jgi:GT2 family glycosyltransferase
MMTRMPVGGNIWLIAHYLLGFRRLGYDVYYVEAHGVPPTKLMQPGDVDGADKAAAFIAATMHRFGFADRWAYHARHVGDQVYGLSDTRLKELYASADLIINLHGGTEPLPEHMATGRLVYLETDPVEMELGLASDPKRAREFVDPYCAMFTWGENYCHPDCAVPMPEGFHFRPTRPPVTLPLWCTNEPGGETFTTIGNWRQAGSQTFNGETYHWSKHYEFLKVLDLPSRSGCSFELALSGKSMTEEDRRLLAQTDWHVIDSLNFSLDLDAYRAYIQRSRGEFTVAKDQNVRLRSGWFSERSATYLAAGRPVITQDTGFGNILPTGEGLFAFKTIEDILDALDRVNSDYERHSNAARAIAREYFSDDVVLGRLLDDLGLRASTRNSQDSRLAIPEDLVIVPVSRRPLRLPEATMVAVLNRDLPTAQHVAAPDFSKQPFATIVIVAFNKLVFSKLCLESLLANTASGDYETIIVDNGSTDGTVQYLRALANVHQNVRIVLNDSNRGFAAANNQGLAMATGDVLILLNNDTVVPPGWLPRLTRHLDDRSIGLVGPVTNRMCNEAQIDAPYRTYGEMLQFSDERAATQSGNFDIRMLAMFCTAMRRSVFDEVGPIDERYDVGMLEDEDYSIRVRNAGYRVVCGEDAFIHHFGEASFGDLVQTGEYQALYDRNRQRFEEKWGIRWEPYRQRRSARYQRLTERIRTTVATVIPEGAVVAVVSRGDDELLQLDRRTGWHFPQTSDGVYTGYYPEDSGVAIAHVEELRAKGADFLLFPEPALWWLSHYTELKQHLKQRYTTVDDSGGACLIFALRRPQTSNAAQSITSDTMFSLGNRH